MKCIWFGVWLLSGAMFAQTAKVIQLSPEDAVMAKSLHEQKEALDKKLADFNDSVRKHYLVEIRTNGTGLTFTYCTGSSCPSYKTGWSGNFEFSDDFRFIVPLPIGPPIPSACPSGWCGLTFNTVTPAFVAN